MQRNSHISAEDFKKLFRPCIYLWYRQNECLYIGASMCGLKRLLQPHQTVNVLEPIQDTDHFEFRWFDNITLTELRLIERKLIFDLSPKYNDGKQNRSPRALLDVLSFVEGSQKTEKIAGG